MVRFTLLTLTKSWTENGWVGQQYVTKFCKLIPAQQAIAASSWSDHICQVEDNNEVVKPKVGASHYEMWMAVHALSVLPMNYISLK